MIGVALMLDVEGIEQHSWLLTGKKPSVVGHVVQLMVGAVCPENTVKLLCIVIIDAVLA